MTRLVGDEAWAEEEAAMTAQNRTYKLYRDSTRKPLWRRVRANVDEIFPEALRSQPRETKRRRKSLSRQSLVAVAFDADDIFASAGSDHNDDPIPLSPPPPPITQTDQLSASNAATNPSTTGLFSHTGPSSPVTGTGHEDGNFSRNISASLLYAGEQAIEFGKIDSDGIDDWIARVGLKQMLSELWGTASTRQEQYELSIKVWDTAANNWHNWAEFGALFWESCRELQVWNVATGGEGAYKSLIRYETVIPEMQAVSVQSESRKKGFYNTIAAKWGQGWDVGFDRDLCPEGKDRFPASPSEKFLGSIACLARYGWDKYQVYYALNWASTLRLSVGAPGFRSRAWFVLADVALAINELGMIRNERPDTTQITIENLCELLDIRKNRALDDGGGHGAGDHNKAGGKGEAVGNEQAMTGGRFAGGKTNARVGGVLLCVGDRTVNLKTTEVETLVVLKGEEDRVLVETKTIDKGKGKERAVDTEELVSSEEAEGVERNPNNEAGKDEEPVKPNTDETGEKGWNRPVRNESLSFEWCPSYRENVAQICDGFRGGLQELQQNGQALVPMDSDFMELMDSIVHTMRELEVYRWHASDRTSGGYLTNCFHSMVRLALAQDPVVYALAVASRSDGLHKLISYPFPPQWLQEGDETPGIILPLNIEAHLAARRADGGIRMMFHVDDEDQETFTKVGRGFDRQRLQDWRSQVVARGEGNLLEAPIRMERVYLDEDIQRYGGFVAAPAKRGDLRLLLPETPFGIPEGGIMTKTQRIVSPHYVALREDSTLEREGLGTLTQIAEANNHLTALSKTPWGTKTEWKNEGYRFPAAVAMTGVWPLGDALLGAASWDSAAVVENLYYLFGSNDAWRQQLVKTVRATMRDRLRKRFETFVFTERLIFSEGSLYRNRSDYYYQIQQSIGDTFPGVLFNSLGQTETIQGVINSSECSTLQLTQAHEVTTAGARRSGSGGSGRKKRKVVDEAVLSGSSTGVKRARYRG